MALIKCPECGNTISDRAAECPHCGRPMDDPLVCPECGAAISHNAQFCNTCGAPVHQDGNGNYHVDYSYEMPKKNTWLWVLAAVLFCLVGCLGYWLYSRSQQDETQKDGKETGRIVFADGRYVYQGSWESSQYVVQSCKLEFEKKEGGLVDCVYTNLRYQSQVPLRGTINGDTLHFVGDVDGKQLVFDLIPAAAGNSLVGEGIDYAHSGDKAKLNLTKTTKSDVDTETAPSYDASRQHDVAELKQLLAKSDGVKFGNSKFQMTNTRYDETSNVVEFRYIQRIFPRSEETPQLLREVAAASKDSQKKSLRQSDTLLKLMQPLRPSIRSIVFYPEGKECFRYDIPFNDLFLDDEMAERTTRTTSYSASERGTERTTSADNEVRKWLRGQWARAEIDPTMVELVYYVYTFYLDGYNFSYGSEYTFNQSRDKVPFTVKGDLICTPEGKPFLKIDRDNEKLIDCYHSEETYKRAR